MRRPCPKTGWGAAVVGVARVCSSCMHAAHHALEHTPVALGDWKSVTVIWHTVTSV